MLGENSKKTKKRKKRAIATVFFRFSHRDKDGHTIKNQQQSTICELIKSDIMSKQNQMYDERQYFVSTNEDGEEEDKSDLNDNLNYHSTTYIPYYDRIPLTNDDELDKEYDFLVNDDTNEGDSLLISSMSPKTPEKDNLFLEAPSVNLPKSESFSRFTPIVAGDSKIMSSIQIMFVARMLPPLFRMREWQKIYSVDTDGVSLQTFYKNAKNNSNCVLFIEDEMHYKFGCYTTAEWAVHKHFYGTGESFLFTFRDTEEDIECYKWAGYNDHIQFSDEKSIAIGGADGKFALYLRNNFSDGVSNKCRTFDNEILSHKEDFE